MLYGKTEMLASAVPAAAQNSSAAPSDLPIFVCKNFPRICLLIISKTFLLIRNRNRIGAAIFAFRSICRHV